MATYSPIAEELNKTLQESSSSAFELLSSYGKRLFFPKGIISQSQEAKAKAHLFNATIGIAKEGGKAMMLPGFDEFFGEKIDSHKILPYAPSGGLSDLRELWQKRQRNLNPHLKHSSLPLVVCGLTHGLSLAGELFLDSGDTVVLPELFWGNYKLMWQVKAQANFISYPFFTKDLKGFNFEAFESAINDVKSDKVFLSLNFPQNPTGYSLSDSESQALLKTLKSSAEKGKKFVVLCDDAYWGLVYEKGYRRESLFSDLADLHENVLAVKLDGCTKEYFMWGLRIGFLTFGGKGMTKKSYEALEKKAAAAIRASISSCSHPSQELLKQVLLDESVSQKAESKYKILQERYDVVKEEVYKKEYSTLWDIYPFNSGYFMCLRLKNNLGAEALRVHLLDKYGVGVVSLGGSDIRVAFSCVEKGEVKTLFEKLADAVRDLS